MNTLLIILLGLIPVTAVLVITFLFLKKEGQKETNYLKLELKKQRQEFFLPSRLEAYQRAILLLERIHPNSLVMRLHNPGMPAKMLQGEFLKAIREEYDHNVAQWYAMRKKKLSKSLTSLEINLKQPLQAWIYRVKY